MQIADLSVGSVGVTRQTDWVHISVTDEHGHVGMGEATLDFLEAPVFSIVRTFADRLIGSAVGSVTDPIERFGLADAFGGLAHAAAVSGTEQALWDLLGRCAGVPVHTMLGSPAPAPVRMYANVNRALLDDRSPDAFAALALRAVDEGYTAVKCAPFDGLVRARLEERGHRRLIEQGLARVTAIRRAVGGEIDVMIDCHYRFTARSAVPVLDRLGAVDPYWVEAPIAETRLAEWAEVRSRTSLTLAGGEMMAGLDRFARFIDATGVDIVMPDVKYAGGISGLRAVAALAASHGISVAPHNPSGPVGTMATLAAASGLANVVIVEHAYGECDWRGGLVGGAERLVDGHLRAPDLPGLGFEFDAGLAAAHPPLARGASDARLRQ